MAFPAAVTGTLFADAADDAIDLAAVVFVIALLLLAVASAVVTAMKGR